MASLLDQFKQTTGGRGPTEAENVFLQQTGRVPGPNDAGAVGQIGQQLGALDAASAEIAAGMEAAAGAIAAGQERAAEASIKSAKIAAKALMEAQEIAIDAQERFFAISDKKLTPFVEQGMVAQDELASMLGIPNAEGDLEPFDIDTLKDTPGYEFVFEEGQRAVIQSAIGSKLSSGTADRLQERGAGLAEQTFNQRATLLGKQADIGLQGATALSQAASNFGGNIGQIATEIGKSQAQVETQKGQQLSDIFTSSAQSIASLEASLGASMADLALARGKVSPFSAPSGGGGSDSGFSLGGGLAGAGAGAKVGSTFGPVGAGVGAAAGGLIGALGL